MSAAEQPGRLFHLALGREWAAALAGTGYRTSTRGRTVDEEGFTHCCHATQVQGVGARYYADVDEPLLLLEIDPTLLTSPVVEEVPPGGDEPFPHVYGPIDVTAVVAAHDVGRADDGALVLPAVLNPDSGSTVPST